MIETQIQLPSYEDMIKAGMHFGRKKTVFNPNMKPFVHAVKDTIHIIDLVKTQNLLKEAIEAAKKVLEANGLILFVGLSPNSSELVKQTARGLNMPYVANRWLGGTLTNFKTIISRVKYLEGLEKEKESGGFEKYTKKERIKKEAEIEKLKEKFDGLKLMTRIPDAIFMFSTKKSEIVIREAKKTGVKVMSIINTNGDPRKVDYPVPANDNSKKSVELIVNSLKDPLNVPSKVGGE